MEPIPSVPQASASQRIHVPEPSSMFLVVLGLSAFCINLGYGIVIPISKELAARCGGMDESAGFTVLAISLMMFNIAKVMGEVPGGIFSDRIGDRVVLAASLFIYGISVVMLISARSNFPFTAARFIEGLATGVSYPSMTSILLKHSPLEKLGRNMSIGLGSGVAGIIFGPVIGSPLTELKSAGLERNIDRPLWFALFLTVGVFALAVGWFAAASSKSLASLPDKVREPDAKTEVKAVAQEALIVAGPGPTPGDPHKKESFVEAIVHEYQILVRFAKSPTFMGLLLPLIFDKLIMCAWQVLLLAHAPMIGFQRPEDVGYLMGGLALMFAVVTPISGLLADRFSPWKLTHVSLIGIVSTLVLFVVGWSKWLFWPTWIGYSIFSATLLTVHLKMVGDIYHEEKSHGRIFGIVHAVSDAGMIFGPPLIWLYTASPAGLLEGEFKHVNYGTIYPIVTFIVMAGVGVLTIPAFVFARGREKNLPRP